MLTHIHRFGLYVYVTRRMGETTAFAGRSPLGPLGSPVQVEGWHVYDIRIGPEPVCVTWLQAHALKRASELAAMRVTRTGAYAAHAAQRTLASAK